MTRLILYKLIRLEKACPNTVTAAHLFRFLPGFSGEFAEVGSCVRCSQEALFEPCGVVTLLSSRNK